MINGTKNAFTLAEVLITLGIIGVVAAMTMPTLLNSTQGAQYRTAYKKALSVLSQAVVMNVALDDYDLAQATVTAAADATNGTSASVFNLFNNRMNVAKTCVGAGCSEGWTSSSIAFGSDATSNYTFFFNDGITLTFKQDDAACNELDVAPEGKTICHGAIDVNGAKNPNRLVTCDNGDPHDQNCKVTNPTDIYPVIMYDQSVLPNSQAARAVLFGGK